MSMPCLTDQPRLSSQARAASSTMDSVKPVMTHIPPRNKPEFRHFGGMLGEICFRVEGARPYPDTLSGFLSGFQTPPTSESRIPTVRRDNCRYGALDDRRTVPFGSNPEPICDSPASVIHRSVLSRTGTDGPDRSLGVAHACVPPSQ